jgi:hypothetical protein
MGNIQLCPDGGGLLHFFTFAGKEFAGLGPDKLLFNGGPSTHPKSSRCEKLVRQARTSFSSNQFHMSATTSVR